MNSTGASSRPGTATVSTPRSSTTRSNGTVACENAWRAVVFDSSINASKLRPGSGRLRSVRVLTNMPTRSSSAAAPRPATGVPTATSVAPDNRASSTAKAACTTMNGVASCRCARARMRAATGAPSRARTVAPRLEATAGRGRSVGSARSSGSPRNCSRQ
ncbi:Uncharacterised protein [Mycobacteroides abscessus subsp. abscessus]|nr:Uncharacterised protein [Mycobacteroides abscessus subsp. abscessus]